MTTAAPVRPHRSPRRHAAVIKPALPVLPAAAPAAWEQGPSPAGNPDCGTPDGGGEARENLLCMLAWAMADDSHDCSWWAGRLGLDDAQLDALLKEAGERLLRARLLRAVAESTGSEDVARAIRARVIEIAAATPKAAVLAQLALTVKRLPGWIVNEWNPEVPLFTGTLRPVEPWTAGADGLPGEPTCAPVDLPELKLAIAEARALLKKMEED